MVELAETFVNGDLVKVVRNGAEIYGNIEALTRHLPRITVTAVAHKLRRRDACHMVICTSDDPVTITLPPSSEVLQPVDTPIAILQYGEGQVTVVAGDGVTIRTPETLKTAKQYAVILLTHLETDEWLLTGNLEAA